MILKRQPNPIPCTPFSTPSASPTLPAFPASLSSCLPDPRISTRYTSGSRNRRNSPDSSNITFSTRYKMRGVLEPKCGAAALSAASCTFEFPSGPVRRAGSSSPQLSAWLGEIPIRGRRANGPEPRGRLKEIEAHCGKAGIGRSEKGNYGFTLIPGLGVHQHKFLSQGYAVFQDDEATVSAHRDRECLLLKRALVFRYAANHKRDVQDQALAASHSRCGS
jgi:hypothetical protein